MRGRVLLRVGVCVLAIACSPVGAEPLPRPVDISIQPSPSPYSRVTAGAVHALVPDGWDAVAVNGLRGGFQASPELERWMRMDGSTAGMAATWVDATRVGVPSDLYYLAASGPLLSRLRGSEHCHAAGNRVLLDRAPAFMGADPTSPGDYVARGTGRCTIDGRPTRWAYFVAAPGYGPVRELGIARSGLYVVVAVLEDSRRARTILRRLIHRATFGGASVTDLLTAARAMRSV